MRNAAGSLPRQAAMAHSPRSIAKRLQPGPPVAQDQVTGRLPMLLSCLMGFALACHIRYTPQRGEEALLQNGKGSEGIQVELHGYGLSIGGGYGAAPSGAQDLLHVIYIPIVHSFVVSIGKEMEDCPCSAVAGESQFGPTLNLHRERDALGSGSWPRKLLERGIATGIAQKLAVNIQGEASDALGRMRTKRVLELK